MVGATDCPGLDWLETVLPIGRVSTVKTVEIVKAQGSGCVWRLRVWQLRDSSALLCWCCWPPVCAPVPSLLVQMFALCRVAWVISWVRRDMERCCRHSLARAHHIHGPKSALLGH